MKLDLPVMLILLSLAACMQEFLPGVPVKVPFMGCVAVYYALQRPFPMAGVAAVAAGVAGDALSGAPVGASSVVLLALAGAAVAARDAILNDSAATAAVCGAAACGLQCLSQRLAIGRSIVAPAGFAGLMEAAGACALCGAAASPLFFMAGRALDRMAMNVKPRKEIDGSESGQSPV